MSLEFLTNANWINSQIDILLYLQNIRNSLGNCFSDFLLSITFLGEYLLPMIIASIIYWCIDSKKGLYLFLAFAINIYIIQFIKMTACVYRPWLLNPNVQPPTKAMLHAGGYSFPSGHSSMSTSFWGSLAWIFKDKLYMIITLISIIFLVCFSRMFLGVHTPQDVFVGFLVGCTVIFSLLPFIKWIEKDKKNSLIALAILDCVLILLLIYILTKNYPIDYVNNKIVVNPSHAIYNTLISYGLTSGFINGLFLFKRFFNESQISIKQKVIKGTIGVVFIIILFDILLESCFKSHTYNYLSGFFKPFILGFFITFIYPVVCKIFKI